MSPVRASPKTQTSAETPMEKQLEAYILEARARNKLVRAAYASAFRDSRTLGNSDASGKNSPINTYGQSHAPYTVDACAKVGQLMGELGRALDTSNRGLSALEQVLKEEKLWSETEDPVMRLSKEKKWWVKEKEERLAKEDRLEAKKLKKKNRRKKGAK